MIRPALLFPFIVAFAALSCSSCRPKPKVTVKAQRLVIKRISLKELTLSVRYLIKNPHAVSLTVQKVDQSISFDKEQVATGALVKQVKIPAKSSESLDVDVIIPFASSLKSVGRLIVGKNMRYEVTSRMVLDTPVGKERRTMIRAGYLQIPIRIGGGLVGIKNPALSGGKLTLDLMIKIPRPRIQMMATKEVSYHFAIEGSTISKGVVKLTPGTGDFQTIKVPVSWPLAKGVGWTSKVMLGQSLKTYFKLKMDLGDETDFIIENHDTFNLQKLNPGNLLKGLVK